MSRERRESLEEKNVFSLDLKTATESLLGTAAAVVSSRKLAHIVEKILNSTRRGMQDSLKRCQCGSWKTSQPTTETSLFSAFCVGYQHGNARIRSPLPQNAGRQSIDNSCRRAHSSKPVAAGLSQQLWANAGTDRRTQDIVSLHRPCSAYSTQEAVPIIQTCLYRAPRGILIGNIGLVYRRAFLLPAVWMSETSWVERRTESTELPSALLAV